MSKSDKIYMSYCDRNVKGNFRAQLSKDHIFVTKTSDMTGF